MPFVYLGAKTLEGKPKVDGGECVRLVQNLLPWIGHTSTWRPGDNVVEALAAGRTIAAGTAIATFVNGRFPTSGHRHAALFLDTVTSCIADSHTRRCKLLAIVMMDQWNSRPGARVQKNTISSRAVNLYGKNTPWPLSDNGSMFYIIE